MQSDLRNSGPLRLYRPFVPESDTLSRGGGGLLARPGILLDMVSLASDDAADLPRLGRRGAFAAIATGSAIGSTWLLAAASASNELPFGAAAGWWSGLVAAAALLAILVRSRVRTAAAAAHVAAALAALLAGAAVAFAVGSSVVALPLLLLAAVGGCGLLPGGALGAGITAAAAGLVLWVWSGSEPTAAMPSLALLAVGSALLAVPLAAFAPRHPAERSPAALRLSRGRVAALACGALSLACLPATAFGLAPGAAWWLAAAAAACGLGIITMQLPVAAVAAVLWSIAGWTMHVAAPAAGGSRVVAEHGGAAVRYQRADQQLALFAGGECIDAVGPDRLEAPLLATLAYAFSSAGDRVALLGLGAGRVGASLEALGDVVLDVVDWRPEAQALRPLLLGDGPVSPRPLPAPAVRRFLGLGSAIEALRPGSRQLVVLGEPLGAVAPRTPELQLALRRAVGAGLVLQAVALDRVAPAHLQQWLAAASAAHPWNGLFVVGDAAVLVSAPQRPAVRATFAQWSDDARWLAHAAHLGCTDDVMSALRGTVCRPREAFAPVAGAVGRAAALAVLHAWLQPEPVHEAMRADSLLSHWTAQQAELRRQVAHIRSLDSSATARAEAQAIALRFLPQGAPHALLQAALGLEGADGVPVVAPATAIRRAFAIDPTWHQSLPPVCAELPSVQQASGELEDLSRLPPPARLAEICAEDTPLGVALRVRFRSACARALVIQLAAAPLSPAASGVLRELADPFVLREAVLVLQARAGERELLGLWRHDLPPPAALAVLLQRSAADRAALATALRGRRDPGCWLLLAALLEAEELDVRVVAGELLRDAVAGAVPYEPQWPQSARHEAAERLRSLHNRAP